MLLAVVLVVVHAEHDRDVGIGRGSRDDHLGGAGVDVLLRAVALREEAGRLEHDVDAEVAPGQLGRVAHGQRLQLVAVDVQSAVADRDVAVERPEHRIVLEQVRHRLQIAEVVERDDLEIAAPVDASPGGSCGRCGRIR